MNYFGIGGCFIILLGVLLTALAYRGRKGERFSLLNHFISELGERSISDLALVFNLGLILGGLLLIPFLAHLGVRLNSIWGWLGCLAGFWTAFSAMMVGLLPMNDLKPHTRAAISYFRGGLATVVLFGLAILLQPAGRVVIPYEANLISLLAVSDYATFLILLNKNWNTDALNALDPASEAERPRFWLLPFMEWMVFFSTMLWFLVMALMV